MPTAQVLFSAPALPGGGTASRDHPGADREYSRASKNDLPLHRPYDRHSMHEQQRLGQLTPSTRAAATICLGRS